MTKDEISKIIKHPIVYARFNEAIAFAKAKAGDDAKIGKENGILIGYLIAIARKEGIIHA